MLSNERRKLLGALVEAVEVPVESGEDVYVGMGS
jgi:hypothetical protein